MADTLQGALKQGRLPGTWRIDVPRQLQGPAVAPRYECATFRRSIAVQYPAAEVEFIHRLHPLFRGVADRALKELTLVPARNGFASRIAVRRHPLAGARPFALFTFLDRHGYPGGRLFGIAVDAAARVVDRGPVDSVCSSDAPPGEVDWGACERVFSAAFPEMQQAASHAARDRLRGQAAATRAERGNVATVLREEAALYRVDRLAEIEMEERAETAGSREQLTMFREAATNWQARRAAVETHYRRRIEQVERFADLPAPPEPQPLGVLLVFPPA